MGKQILKSRVVIPAYSDRKGALSPVAPIDDGQLTPEERSRPVQNLVGMAMFLAAMAVGVIRERRMSMRHCICAGSVNVTVGGAARNSSIGSEVRGTKCQWGISNLIRT